MEKKNIKKYAGACVLGMALTTAGILGITIGVYESSVNHDREYCHLCDVIGLQHQADAINNGTNGFRYHAVYDEGIIDEQRAQSGASLYDFTHGHVINYAYNIATYEQPGGYFESGGTNYRIEKVQETDILEDGYGYSLNDSGYLTNQMYIGERVDVYDHDGTLRVTFK